MVPTGNKAKCLSSFNHTTKTILHHHQRKSINLEADFFVWDLLKWSLKKLLSYLKSAPSNLSKWKVSCKLKTQSANKMPYFGVSMSKCKKSVVIFEINSFEFAKMQSLLSNNRNQLRTNFFVWDLLNQTLKKLLSYWELGTFEFEEMQSQMKNKKL